VSTVLDYMKLEICHCDVLDPNSNCWRYFINRGLRMPCMLRYAFTTILADV